MSRLHGDQPSCEIKGTDSILYSGIVPSCAVSEDCAVDSKSLTYLIALLLTRYCAELDIIDADLSTVDVSCLLAANPDIELPDNVTIETLSTFFKNHICAVYSLISDLTTQVESQLSLICLNDLAQTNENTPITIDALFNDITSTVSGTLVLTVTTPPINGTYVINGDKTITYTPDDDFVGNDSITYTFPKGGKTCTAKISIKVNQVLTEDDINTIVTNQLIVLLSSNEYWDLGIPKGTKVALSDENLTDFDFTGITPGKGKTGTKWKKWAICNGYNLAEDFTKSTLRGFDHTDSDYNTSGLQGGSDTYSLLRTNIPAHRHGQVYVLRDENTVPSQFGASLLSPVVYASNEADDSGAQDCKYVLTNTGDGTDNVSSQDLLPDVVTPLDLRNDYKTIILAQKVEV